MKIKNKKEIGIGLTVLVALLCIFFLINYLKGINIFHTSNYYTVTYTDVKGLNVSAPVTLNGFKVGQVREIEYDYNNPGHISVELSVSGDLRVPEGSVAKLVVDMLGTASITLELAPGKNFLPVGAELKGVVGNGMVESLEKDVLPQVAPVLAKVDSLVSGLNKLVSDPALGATVQRLDGISANLAVAVKNLNRASASLPGVMDNVDKTTANLAVLSQNISVFAENLNRIPLDSTMRNVQVISDNLRELSADLRNPDSSLGMLLNDPTLYNSLTRTVNNLDSLFIDIKKNPKRYINVKLL